MCSSFSTDLSFMGHSNLKAIQAHTLKRESGCYLFFLSSHDVVHSRATLSCYFFILVFFFVVFSCKLIGTTQTHLWQDKCLHRPWHILEYTTQCRVALPYPCFKFNISQFPIQTTQIKNFTQIYTSGKKLCNSKVLFTLNLVFELLQFCLLKHFSEQRSMRVYH